MDIWLQTPILSFDDHELMYFIVINSKGYYFSRQNGYIFALKDTLASDKGHGCIKKKN